MDTIHLEITSEGSNLIMNINGLNMNTSLDEHEVTILHKYFKDFMQNKFKKSMGPEVMRAEVSEAVKTEVSEAVKKTEVTEAVKKTEVIEAVKKTEVTEAVTTEVSDAVKKTEKEAEEKAQWNEIIKKTMDSTLKWGDRNDNEEVTYIKEDTKWSEVAKTKILKAEVAQDDGFTYVKPKSSESYELIIEGKTLLGVSKEYLESKDPDDIFQGQYIKNGVYALGSINFNQDWPECPYKMINIRDCPLNIKDTIIQYTEKLTFDQIYQFGQEMINLVQDHKYGKISIRDIMEDFPNPWTFNSKIFFGYKKGDDKSFTPMRNLTFLVRNSDSNYIVTMDVWVTIKLNQSAIEKELRAAYKAANEKELKNVWFEYPSQMSDDRSSSSDSSYGQQNKFLKIHLDW